MTNSDELLRNLEEQVRQLTGEIERLKEGTFTNLKAIKSFQVQDAQGNARVIMVTDDAGDPSIGILDSNGKVRITFGAEAASCSFSLRDAREEIRLKITINDNAEPIVMLADERGDPVLSLSALENSARILMHDKSQILRIALSTEPDASIWVNDRNGVERIGLETRADGCFVVILDESRRLDRGL